MTDDEPRVFDASLVVLERNRLLRAGAIALVIGAPLLFATLLMRTNPFGFLGIHVFALGLWLGSLARQNARAKKRRAHVRVTPDGIAVGGKLRVPRAKIADGFFQPRHGGAYGSSVRFTTKHGNVAFEAEADENEALEMLAVLGLDPGRRRAEFRGSSPLQSTLARQMLWSFGIVGVVTLLATIVTALAIRGGPPAPLVFVPLLLAGMLPSKIVVGVDGVLVRWLWQQQFISMADVRSVTRDGDRGIRFHLASGKDVVVYTAMRRKYKSSDAAQHRDAVLARIAEALATFRARGEGVNVSSLVARGTRSREEWLLALKKLRGAGAEGGYRDAVLRDEDLWRLVEDPAAPEDARAGAAMILRRSLDESGRARVRVAAEATASPRLRVALAAAAADATAASAACAATATATATATSISTDEDAALEAALGEIAEEQAKR